MAAGVKLPAQRLAICKLILAVVMECCAVYLGTSLGASVADELLLCVAVLIGQLERKRMTAGKVAVYVGMNRITATRKLERLRLRGLVEERADGTYALPVARLNSPEVLELVKRLDNRVQATAAQLFKLNA
jgi:DNA-binding transcriptional ArsR family regulator